MKDLTIVSNEVTRDARVLREAGTLVGGGYGVSIIGWDRRDNLPVAESVDGIEITRAKNSLLMRLPFGL